MPGAVYVERDTYILMVSYKWGHDRTVKTAAFLTFLATSAIDTTIRICAAFFIVSWMRQTSSAPTTATPSTSRKSTLG
jgi:hypothetical protein